MYNPFEKPVLGYGPVGAQLCIIGIAPDAESLISGKPFSGQAGNILKQDLHEAGISIHDTYRTNVFKYKLPDNEFAKYKEIGLSLPDAIRELQQEIVDLNPNCILGLGDPVLYSLAGKSGKNNGINTWRGSILPVWGKKSVFTWHPAAELYGSGEGTFKSWQSYVRKFDIKRAVEESYTPDWNLPHRITHIARSSSDLYRFIERNFLAGEQYVALDIEAIESLPVCIGLSFTPEEAMIVPLWNTLPINVKNERHKKKSYKYDLEVSKIPTQDIAYIWHLLSMFLMNQLEFRNKKINFNKIGQNFKYDEAKLNNLGLYLDELFWDISFSQHCIASEMPKSLAFQTSIKTREPYYKYEGKEFVPQRDKIDDFFNYCGKDCCTTREIFNVDYKDLSTINHGLEHIKFRMSLHKPYLEMEKVGFQIDEWKRTELIHKYVRILTNLEKELFSLVKDFGITEPINVLSNPQIHKLLYITLHLPQRDGAGEQVLTALMANVIKDKPRLRICELILEIRRVHKTLGTYLSAEPDFDGRMKTTYRITGTENYRTSTGILEPPIRPMTCGWAFHTVTKHGDVGQDLRSILVADKGYIIVNIDQSQAEARVCSLLAEDYDKLKAYDERDVHGETAAKFFGARDINQYSKKRLGYECAERFVGKTLRHAYHLDIGKREAMVNVNTDARKYKININISEWFAGQCLKALEKDTPKIKEVFHGGIQELLRQDRRIYGTFGASRYFYDEEGRDLWKSAYSFIPQQTVSDKTKYVLVKIHKYLWDVKLLVEAHDAIAMMIRESVLNERIEQILEWFSEPIDFSMCSMERPNLVIPSEVEIGYNYKDLKDYKI